MKTCEGCDVCCVTPYIKELTKDAHEKCPHLSRKKCAIYKDRPPICVDFNCFWLIFDEPWPELKPSACGLLMYLSRSSKVFNNPKSPFTLMVMEARKNALIEGIFKFSHWWRNFRYAGHPVTTVIIRYPDNKATVLYGNESIGDFKLSV